MSKKLNICLAQLNPTVGDIKGNFDKLIQVRNEAQKQNSDIILFTEMFLSGYPIDDLVLRSEFIESINHHINLLKKGVKYIFPLPDIKIYSYQNNMLTYSKL